MKRFPIAAVLALTFAAGCKYDSQDINDHWNARSVGPRAGRFFLGYDGDRDGSYMDFQWERKKDLNLTMRRHLMNHNPDNPYHGEVPARFEPRPVWSPGPNPWPYIHLEGLIIGFAAFTGSGFFPIPVDSIIATATEDEHLNEFMAGVTETFSPLGVVTSSFLNTWIGPPMKGAVTTVHKVLD